MKADSKILIKKNKKKKKKKKEGESKITLERQYYVIGVQRGQMTYRDPNIKPLKSISSSNFDSQCPRPDL